MPFGKTPEEKLFYDMVYDHIIFPAFQKAGLIGVRIDRETVGDKPLNDAIEKRLQKAPLVIADLSGNNPNVLYELGYRRAHGKPFVCISSKPSDAAFWAGFFQIIDYTKQHSVARIAEAITQVYAEFNVRSTSENRLVELSETVRDRGVFDNPFQDRMAAWRIGRTWEDVKKIQHREWTFEAKTSANYVTYVFNEIMRLLEPGEEYYTITNLKFWQDKAIKKTGFLTANNEAALRGVTIKRVFLIDKEELRTEATRREAEAVLKDQIDVCDRVESMAPGKMTVKGILCDNFKSDFGHYGHFGVARHLTSEGVDKGCVVIVPKYTASYLGSSISHLTLTFSEGPSLGFTKTMESVDRFSKAFEQAKDLRQILAAIRRMRAGRT